MLSSILSGIAFPTELLPKSMIFLGDLLPTTHFLKIFRSDYSSAINLQNELIYNFIALIFLTTLTLSLGVYLLQQSILVSKKNGSLLNYWKLKIEIENKLIIENFDDGMIILNMSSGKYIEFNVLGQKIFSLLEKYGDTEKIFIDLINEFDVDEKVLRKDIESFIKKLEKLNILKINKI